jgi:hypothetical protein
MYDDHTLAIKNAPLVGNNNNWWLLIEIYDIVCLVTLKIGKIII